MKKTAKKLRMVAVGSVLTMLLSVTAFAASTYSPAWDSFDTKLPATQGDTHVSTVARASSDIDHFTINITSLSDGYTACRAWAEGKFGGNYSNPYNQVPVGTSTSVSYYSDSIPEVGTNLILNLDNPVYTSITPLVTGKWTPN